MNRDRQEQAFLKGLQDAVRAAGENGGVISSEALEELFSGLTLTKEQMADVRTYLTRKGIGIDSTLPLEDRITQEEHSYLEEYRQMIEAIELPSEGVLDAVRLSAMAGERQSQEDLILYSLRNVLDIAQLYAGQGVSVEDLIGAGNEALTIGVSLLAPLETPSETEGFLAGRIMDAMENLISINIDNKAKDKEFEDRVNHVAREAAALAEELGRPVTASELAAESGIAREEIEEIMRLSGGAIRDLC